MRATGERDRSAPATRPRASRDGSVALAALSLTVVLLAVAAGVEVRAEAEPAARALLDESSSKNGVATWRDRTLDLTIESRSGDSVARVRTARVQEANGPDGDQRTFMEFRSPADVEGTLYLHERPRDGEEAEWIYVVAARRPRRLTPGQSDETSTGAELGYRAVEGVTRVLSWGPDDADASLVGDEDLGGRACRVVRVVPHAPEPGAPESYDVWLGADDLRPYRIVPHGGERAPREIVLADYEVVDGHATPRTIDVVGRDDAWRTLFRLSDVRYDVGLPDGTFSLARLSKGR